MSADLLKLGENTAYLDCDVIDADGGTRCAGITGAATALAIACRRGVAKGIFPENPFKESVAAISVGVIGGVPMLDLCYEEDSNAEVDMNVVMTESGKLVEVQGTCRRGTFLPRPAQRTDSTLPSTVSNRFSRCSARRWKPRLRCAHE